MIETYQWCVPNRADEAVDSARRECTGERLGSHPEGGRHGHSEGGEQEKHPKGVLYVVFKPCCDRWPFEVVRNSLTVKASS